jgi:Divergent CRAL/TRIO domain
VSRLPASARSWRPSSQSPDPHPLFLHRRLQFVPHRNEESIAETPSLRVKCPTPPSARLQFLDSKDHFPRRYFRIGWTDKTGSDLEGNQMICICACHFPSPDTIEYDKLLALLLESIDSHVTTEYSLVFFAGHAEHKPSLAWTLSAYQSLGRKYRKGIKRLYIVHSGTWTRIVLEVAGRVVSPKFSRKIRYTRTLSELAESVPITQVCVPWRCCLTED